MPRVLGFSDGSSMSVNRAKEAGVKTLGFADGSSIVANRTASPKIGVKEPLLSKVVGGAAAAYSLRDLNDKQGESKAVRVRRESDNEERDFVVKEVSSGIADWANGKLDTALPANQDATQTIRIEGGSEVAGVYIARGVVNNKPSYFNDSLTVPTKLIFTSGNPRWLIQKQTNQTLVNSTTTGEDEATPVDITNVATYFSGTGTKLVTSIKAHYSAAAAAYSLRKVNSSHGTDIVKLSSLEDARLDDLAAEYTSFGNRLTLPSGISIRNFKSSSAVTASRTYTNGIVTLNVTSNGNTSAGGFNSTLRFEDLTPNKRYVIKGETRVTKNTLTGTNPLATARVDINDQYNQVAIYTAANTTDWTPFSVVGDTRSSLIVSGAEYNAGSRFIDIAAQTGGTNISGEVTVQFKNIQIVEDPNYVVRIRRGDNVEADVKFDSNDKLSLNSEVVNTHEDTNASGTSNGVRSRYDYDTGSTTARTLGNFLNESIENFSPVTYPNAIASTYRQWSSLTATSNSFVATTETVDSNAARYNYILPSSISADEGGTTTFRISGTVDYTTSTGSGDGFFLKFTNYINGGGSHDFGSISLSGVGTIQNNKLRFNHGDNGNFSIDVTGNGINDIRSIVFSQTEVASGTTSISLTNLKFEIIKHGATVQTWYNQATFNEDAVQQVATKQPKIAANGALLADGISFDGTDDHLVTQGVLTSNASASLFIKATALTADATFTDYFYTEGYSGADMSTSEVFGIGYSDGGDITYTSASSEIGSISDGLGGNLSNGALVSLIGGASTTSAFLNGALQATESTPTNASGNHTITTSGTIGGHSTSSSLGKFKMSEIIIYASDQSNNRFKIESNINNYYSLYTNAENAFVSTWYDQSGHDRHASQVAELAQPFIVKSGNITKTEDGNPAVAQENRSTGNAAGLRTEYNPTGTDGALTEYSIFIHYEALVADSLQNKGALFTSGGVAGNSAYGGLIIQNTSGDRVFVNNTDGTHSGGGTFSNATSYVAVSSSDSNAYGSVRGQHCVSAHFKHGVGLITRFDGVESSDPEPNAPIPHASKTANQGKILLMGEYTYKQTNPWRGRVSEIIFYEKDHRLNTLAIEANINSQYGIY